MPAQPLTDAQLKEAQELKQRFRLWQASRRQAGGESSQEWAAEQLGFGQSALNQYLNGKIPLNAEAASKFASLMAVQVADFSPTIASHIARLSSSHDKVTTPTATIADATGADVPPGYVRLEHLSPRPAMGDGGLVDVIHVVRHLDVLEQWVRQKVGSTNPERIQVLTAKGRSMMPTIQDQDLVFVDVWQKDIREPGIYVIDVAGRLLLKKALIQSTGTLILRSDNVDEYPDEERHDLEKVADTIHVSGRVLAWWTLRRG